MSLHIAEVRFFTGSFIGAAVYGIVVVMFFRCMNVLLGKTGTTRWVFIIHTTTMFLLATVAITMRLYILPISYIDNREFPGSHHAPFSGPVGYQGLVFRGPLAHFPTIVLFLNNWLVEGLLLYRCFVIYNMNYRAIAFPCLMYLTSSALGVLIISQNARLSELIIAMYTITHSLNILLTLTIVIRIITHSRRFRNTTGQSYGVYNAIATILVESCVLYTVPILLCFIPIAAHSSVGNFFFFTSCLAAQLIPPFFVILRVANRTAFAPGMMESGSNSSIHYNNHRGSASCSAAASSPTSPMDVTGETPGGLCAGAESSHSTIEEVPMNGDQKTLKSLIP